MKTDLHLLKKNPVAYAAFAIADKRYKFDHENLWVYVGCKSDSWDGDPDMNTKFIFVCTCNPKDWPHIRVAFDNAGVISASCGGGQMSMGESNYVRIRITPKKPVKKGKKR
jgi:hypothetical protein